MISQRMSEYVDGLMAEGTVDDPKGNLNYLKVQAEEEAAAQESSEAASEEGAGSEDEGSSESAVGSEDSESSEASGGEEDAGAEDSAE